MVTWSSSARHECDDTEHKLSKDPPSPSGSNRADPHGYSLARSRPSGTPSESVDSSQFHLGTRPAIIVAMTDRAATVTIPGDAPTAVELLLAVRGGDTDLVRRLRENPDLARARFAAEEVRAPRSTS